MRQNADKLDVFVYKHLHTSGFCIVAHLRGRSQGRILTYHTGTPRIKVGVFTRMRETMRA